MRLRDTLRLCAMALLGLAAPALAQQAEDLDALIDASGSPDAALELARRQETDGDLLGAAATLERALLASPEGATAAVRLHYVALLCRLDDKPTARAELARLDGRGIGDAAWRETVSACGALPRPSAGPARRRAGLSGEIAAGLAYDRDAAGALLVQFDVPGFMVPRDDGASFVGSARVAGRAPFGRAFVYGDAALLTKDAIAGPKLDYRLGDLHLGLGGRAGRLEASLGGVVRQARVSGNRFVTETGVEGEVALARAGDSRIALHGELAGQHYAGSTPAFSRDGTRFDLAALLQGRTDDGLDFLLGAAFEHKAAETARTGYAGGRLFGSLRSPVGAKGMYGTLAGVLRSVEYEDAAGFVPVSEKRYFARGALGLPLGGSGVAVEAAGSYTIRNYGTQSGLADYSSAGAELRLVWAFGN